MRDLRIWLLTQLLVAWLWLNLVFWRLDYVRHQVDTWLPVQWVGSRRGWVVAAQHLAAHRLDRQPPKLMAGPFLLWVITYITFNLALGSTISNYAVSSTIGITAGLVVLSAWNARRALYGRLHPSA